MRTAETSRICQLQTISFHPRVSARTDSTAATAAAAAAPVLMVTNDDGIDAPGLRFLVDQLVAAGRYRVLVCAPDT